MEIFPTLLDITEISKPDSLILDGFSILPLLIGDQPDLEREEMFWEFRDEFAARVGPWKWIKSGWRDNHNGLFNLSEDIEEKNDLSTTNNDELNRVKEKFFQWQKEMDRATPRGPFKNF